MRKHNFSSHYLLSTASQVVTTSTQPAKSTDTLHSTGFWESAQPIPSREEGDTVKPTTTTSAPTVTEIPMEVDDDVIFFWKISQNVRFSVGKVKNRQSQHCLV